MSLAVNSQYNSDDFLSYAAVFTKQKFCLDSEFISFVFPQNKHQLLGDYISRSAWYISKSIPLASIKFKYIEQTHSPKQILIMWATISLSRRNLLRVAT